MKIKFPNLLNDIPGIRFGCYNIEEKKFIDHSFKALLKEFCDLNNSDFNNYGDNPIDTANNFWNFIKFKNFENICKKLEDFINKKYDLSC